MKYMLLTYLDEQAWLRLSETEQRQAMAECEPHVKSLIQRGKLLAGAPLEPTTMATTVRIRDSKRLVTDGPFEETREQLGGYTIINANDLDDAISIASGFLGSSSMATIEIRPIVDIDSSMVPALVT